MDGIKTLIQAIQYFSDEQVCIDTVANMRWPEGVKCPDVQCAASDPYYLNTQKRWKCRKCRKQFSVKVNTIFEDSAIPLSKWLPALWLLVNCKNGISSHEVARDLGITQKSAWFVLQRLRLALKARDFGTKFGSNDGGIVEVDESFVGGKVKNMHKSRSERLMRTTDRDDSDPAQQAYYKGNKTAVLGMFDRETKQVRTKVVPNVRRDTLQAEIQKNIKYGSAIYTDQAVVYDNLRRRYTHETVNHAETYVYGKVHTNSLENFWSLMKRNLSGTYVCVDPTHLGRYLDEQVFRFNNRKTTSNPLDDSDRFLLALSQVSNRRLKYKDLISRDESFPVNPSALKRGRKPQQKTA